MLLKLELYLQLALLASGPLPLLGPILCIATLSEVLIAAASRQLYALKVHGEVRVYRGTGVSRGVRRTTWERSLKKWELQISCLEEFLGGGNVLGLFPASLPHTLGYACTFYAPTSPPPSSIERRTKNQPKEEVFGTDIPRTSGGHSRGYPGPKLWSGPSKLWKYKHFGAGIRGLKARTSPTLRGFQKLRSEKLWAEFSFRTIERGHSEFRSCRGATSRESHIDP